MIGTWRGYTTPVSRAHLSQPGEQGLRRSQLGLDFALMLLLGAFCIALSSGRSVSQLLSRTGGLLQLLRQPDVLVRERLGDSAAVLRMPGGERGYSGLQRGAG